MDKIKLSTHTDRGKLLFWAVLVSVLILLPMSGFLARNTSILSPYPSILFALVALACFVCAWLLRRHYIKAAVVGLLAIGMTILSIGVGVNAYVGYFPTLSFLFGQQANDMISPQLNAQILSPNATTTFLGSVHQPGRGGVLQLRIPNTKSKFRTNDALVYLPPAWFMQNHPSLPVVVMLGGAPGLSKDWTQAGALDRTADSWARQHNGITPIFVLPDYTGGLTSLKAVRGNDSECVNGKYGNVETYLTVDLPIWVQHTFKTEPQPSHWAIGGFSLGGYCAMTLSLRHQKLYGIYLDISGETRIFEASKLSVLYPPGTNIKKQLNAHSDTLLLEHPGNTIGCYIAGSDETANLKNLQQLRTIAASSQAELGTSVLVGSRHTWSYAELAFQKAFPWLAGELRAGTNEIPDHCLQT